MNLSNNPDVVIVGGGIAGASTLYYLSKFGINNVLLIEKAEYLAYGITRHTAGQVMLQMDNEFDIFLSQYSLDELKELEKITGINIYKQKTGMLTVSPGVPYREKLQEWFDRQEMLGIPTEVWDTKKIELRVPLLNTKDIDFGVFSEQDGVVDADRLVNAYAKWAKERGAKVMTSTEVIGIRVKSNRIIGIETKSQGFIETKTVVNAAGLNAKKIGSWVGLDMPLSNTWRFNGFTKQLKHYLVPENMPTIEVLHQEPDKIIYVGPQKDSVDFTIGVFPVSQYGNNASPKLMLEEERYSNELERRFPKLFESESYENPQSGQFDEKRGNGSPRCSVNHAKYPQDNNPILGPADSIEGYYNNCGWGGLGITHGPIGGKLVAASIAGESDLPINIEPFLLKRFENYPVEGNKKMPQHTTVKVTDRPILYDWMYNDYIVDIPMYQILAGNTNELLECGIGTGRIAIPLAKEGKTVYGVDNSEPMLDLLSQKLERQSTFVKERIHFFNQDMRNFNLGRKFSYVYVPFSTFNYLLNIKDQRDTLNSIKNHLNDDGELVLELLSFSYQPFGLVHSNELKVIKREKSLSSEDEVVELTVRSEFDSSTQIVREWRYFNYYNNDGKLLRTELVEWDNRFFFIGELECVLESTGFEIIKRYGDHSLKNPLTHESEFAVIIAKQK